MRRNARKILVRQRAVMAVTEAPRSDIDIDAVT
jgi:hypothetical protein